MNDGPYKLHTGYLVEGLELFIRKVVYTKYDATVLVRWSNYMRNQSVMTVQRSFWRVHRKYARIDRCMHKYQQFQEIASLERIFTR
jgi:hypothetical protein